VDQWAMCECIEALPVVKRVLDYVLQCVHHISPASISTLCPFIKRKPLKSAFADARAMLFLDTCIPALHQGVWTLLYSSATQGESFSTFRFAIASLIMGTWSSDLEEREF
jgi:hypothetical protein